MIKAEWTNKDSLDLQQTCNQLATTDGDLISRQDALKPFCVAPDGTRIPEVDCDNFPVEFSVEFIKKHLLSLPSAEPKTGEWIRSHIGTIAEGFYCSRCGKSGYQTDFCQSCGADMRKGGEDE